MMAIFNKKQRGRTSYKQLCLIIIMFCILLVTPVLVSSANFDNIKGDLIIDETTSEYGKIEIRDWFGLQDLAELELKNNTDICGASCSMETEIIMHQDGALIDDVKFVGGSIKSSQFYIQDGDEWKEYKLGEEVIAGTYYIKLEGKKDFMTTVDWQITSQGKLIDEWALWTTGGQGLSAYWTMNETSGNVIDMVGNANGILIAPEVVQGAVGQIGTAYNFTGNPSVNVTIADNANLTLSNNMAISLWVYGNNFAGTDYIINKGVFGNDGYGIFIASSITFFTGTPQLLTATNNNIASNKWTHIVVNVDSGTARIYINGTEATYSAQQTTHVPTDGATILSLGCRTSGVSCFNGTLDEVGLWNRTLTTGEISDLYNDGNGLTVFSSEDDGLNPRLDLISPTEIVDYGISPNQTLTWNATDSSLESVWFSYNGTNRSLTANSGVEISHSFTLANAPHNLTLYANDSFGNVNSSFREWEYRMFQTGEKFINPTSSGVLNEFILNITTDGNAITIASLNYNGTNTLGSISSNGNDYTLTRNQIALGVSTSTNISFFWNITQEGGINVATDSQNQTVNPLVVNETCTGMSTIFNFTLADEVTQSKLNGSIFNVSIKVNLDLFTLDRTVQLVDFFKEFSIINPVGICINSNLSNEELYSLDLQVQYSAENHSIEFYNIQDQTLNEANLVQNITLYDLDIPNTQKFRLRVRDTSFLPIDGGLVQIERKYLENGTFFITEIPKTDENGITSANLQLDDVIYNFKIFSAGLLISSFNNVLAICQTPLVSQCEIDFNAFQSEITIPNYEEGDDFNFTLGYNDTSRVVSSQFIIPSGEPSVIKLLVIREDTLGTAVCEDTITTSVGTLTCIVPSSFGNSTVLARILKDDVEQGKGNIKLDQKSSDIFPGILIMLSVLVMMTLIGVGVSDSPVITAVFLFVGVMLLVGINLIQNTGFIGATATILFFAIAVILVLIKASRRS